MANLTEQEKRETHWHVDRRVPVALLFGIFIQTATAIWWASGVTNDVENITIALSRQDNRIATLEGQVAQQSLRDERASGQINTLTTSLNRLQQDIKETNELLREYLRDQLPR